jgi:serine protease inhibitor
MRSPPTLLSAVSTAAFALSMAVGCSSEDTEPPRQPRQVTELSAELSDVVDGNTTFAWSMYDQIRLESGNVFFSPFSISAALGMTYAGAAGSTASQMQQVLHVQQPDTFHASFGALIRDLDGDKGRGYSLFIANRLFGQDGFAFAAPFLGTTSEHYGAELELVDFVGAPDPSRIRINEWVADKTRDKIPELLEPGTIDSLTRLVLANAIYFKANWAEQFDKEHTRDRPFELRDGTEVQVPMMSRKADCRTIRGTELAALEMDYQDGEVSMVIVIPRDDVTVEAMEAVLTQKGLDPLIDDMQDAELEVELPRFEFRDKTDLGTVLETLGMVDAFDPAKADFSAMAPGEPIFLQRVVHEAYVKVDEEGTEAAAATAVVAGTTSSGPPGFVVDRPFVFAIRDKLTNSILFLGRVDDPRAE